jgi:hypothetical protein
MRPASEDRQGIVRMNLIVPFLAFAAICVGIALAALGESLSRHSIGVRYDSSLPG